MSWHNRVVQLGMPRGGVHAHAIPTTSDHKETPIRRAAFRFYSIDAVSSIQLVYGLHDVGINKGV